MDKIFLKGCRFYGYHGVFPEEAKLGQIFCLDLELQVDLQAASLTDNLHETVHYGHVFDLVRHQVEQQRYALIERLAGAICQDIFDHFPTVKTIKISISKENPPIPGHYDAVGISLERSRP